MFENYIPKEATQQSEFLKKYPKYDGRGIKIAIIDTDIADISLPGLQKTSTGLPKIIDCIGKPPITVNTSKIVKTIENDYIIGLSGRKLKIPSTWENISDEWHIGSVTAETLFDLQIAGKEYIQFKEQKSNKNKQMINSEIVDCIVWFDGEKWRTCIDTSFSTDLNDVKVLTNFEDEYDVATNTLIYCVNIFEEGNLIQLFPPQHYHGTAVTQVAAAYFLNNPDGCGLAIGSQIVTMHYKNLEESLLKCIEHKVDIVNFCVTVSLTPELKKIVIKMVEEYGMIITEYAGNLGCFYSAVFSKIYEIREQTFLIGSVFTADQLKLKEKLRNKESVVNSVHKYSSKGPLISSGARGIDFVAPGAGIIDLPKWYISKNAICEGTSFATPNVAGSIACLLSALKANKIPYTPGMIKLALANTAYLPEGADKLAFGNGIIQIKDAFEFIKKSINNLPTKCLMPISIDKPNQRGIIFYQNKYKLPQTYRYYVNIDPELNTKWILKCFQNDKKFVTYHKTDNFFTVNIDTSLLEEGSINYAEISGIDSSNPSIGPIFHLPITVILPADSFIDKEILLKPGPPTHFFFKCPSESQQYSIKITCFNNDKNDESKIRIEMCQKKNFTVARHDLKFTAKNSTITWIIRIEKDEEPFEICFYHQHLTTLNIKMDFQLFMKNKKIFQ